MSESFMIGKRIRCSTCDGTGEREQLIDIVELLQLADLKYFKSGRNKISFIKDVRSKWELNLVDAKDLAELVIDFVTKAENSSHVRRTHTNQM